jgi:hypothetical protein
MGKRVASAVEKTLLLLSPWSAAGSEKEPMQINAIAYLGLVFLPTRHRASGTRRQMHSKDFTVTFNTEALRTRRSRSWQCAGRRPASGSEARPRSQVSATLILTLVIVVSSHFLPRYARHCRFRSVTVDLALSTVSVVCSENEPHTTPPPRV